MNETLFSDAFLEATKSAPKTRVTIAKAVMHKTDADTLFRQLLVQLDLAGRKEFIDRYPRMFEFVFLSTLYFPGDTLRSWEIFPFSFTSFVDPMKRGENEQGLLTHEEVFSALFPQENYPRL